jgi:hypothetical protein
MQKELSYLSPEGYTVFTSQFLKNRGTCCKSSCLHCPFGYTLKKCGLEFQAVTESEFESVEKIFSDVSTPTPDWKSFYPENILLIKLKGSICGLLLKNHIVVKQLFLLPQFQNQGLSKEMVESYLFI